MGDKYRNVYRRNRAKPVNHGSDVTCFHGNVSIRPGWFTGNRPCPGGGDAEAPRRDANANANT